MEVILSDDRSDSPVSDTAKVIERRPWPSYEERMAVFWPAARPEPSRELFAERTCSQEATGTDQPMTRDESSPKAVLHRVWVRACLPAGGRHPRL